MPDALPGLLASSRDSDGDGLALLNGRSKRGRDLMQVDDLNSADLRHALEARVAGGDPQVIACGALHKHAISATTIEWHLLNTQVHAGVRLHATDCIQPTPPTRSLLAIFTVAQRLQFIEDEPWYHQMRIHKPSRCQRFESTIDQR